MELATSICPHREVMQDCSDIWCRSRLADNSPFLGVDRFAHLKADPNGPDPVDGHQPFNVRRQQLQEFMDYWANRPSPAVKPVRDEGSRRFRVTPQDGCAHGKTLEACLSSWCSWRHRELSAEPQLPDGPKHNASELILHMARYYSDFHVKHDLDCVLGACATPEARKAVEEYARARQNAPDWSPRSYREGERHSSHQPWMLNIGATDTTMETTVCANCGNPVPQKRSTKRFCTEACKKRAGRKMAPLSR